MIVTRPDEPQSDPIAAADHVALYPWELSDEAMEAIRKAVPPAESFAMNALMDDPSDAGGIGTVAGSTTHEHVAAAALIPVSEERESDHEVNTPGN